MNNYFLVLQADYHNVSLGLYNSTQLLHSNNDTKHNASKNLVTRINSILNAADLSWDDLSFIAANQGPAPFTTLRVIITTMNGLNFAKKIQLVGVDGIKTFLQEQSHSTPLTIVLLNAFAKDVYFGIKKDDHVLATGWENVHVFLERIQKEYPQTPITFVGNGVELFRKEVETVFTENAIIPNPLPNYCSLDAVAQQALIQWEQKDNVHNTLLPLYLKTQEYKKST